ncbi:MAG: hypothetical protein HYT73_02510 [Candidatus Aenigmarchaeota archaeon]|nr:hypothetical protein [Candidatus Aenigmarchaeota archaeon]
MAMNYAEELRTRRQELSWDDWRVSDSVANRVFRGMSIVQLKTEHGDGEYDPSQETRVLENYRRNFKILLPYHLSVL